MAGPTRSSTNWSTGGAHTDYSSSSTPGFIPEVWSGKLNVKWYLSTVFASISSTDYEGEIKNLGDNIIIRTVPDITISAYEIGGGLTYQIPSSNQVEMAIDKAKSFAFQVNDVDAMQSDLKLMDKWSDDAAMQMKITVDSDVLDNLSASINATNKGTTAGAISGNLDLGTTAAAETITSSNAIDYLMYLGQVLDESNVPETDRWLVIPAWYNRMLKLSDLKDASITGDGTSVMRNGRVGMLDRFTVYMSNQVKTASDTGTKYHVTAGHPKALAFAAQMTKMEQLDNPSDFGQLVRGLNVYGYKVVKDDGLAELYCNP